MLGVEGRDMGLEGWDGRRKGRSECGLWSYQIGPNTEGIQEHELHYTLKGQVGVGDFSGIGKMCSNLAVFDSHSGCLKKKKKKKKKRTTTHHLNLEHWSLQIVGR